MLRLPRPALDDNLVIHCDYLSNSSIGRSLSPMSKSKSEFPYTLLFRDRANVQQPIRITQAELDALRGRHAVVRNVLRRRQYNLIGVGTEFSRENGLLCFREFQFERANSVSLPADPIHNLHVLGLHQEANWLALCSQFSNILPKAPFKSGAYTPHDGLVLGLG